MTTWRDIEELADRRMLVQLIEEEGTATRIARRLGCSIHSVNGAMRFYGLEPKFWKTGENMRKRLKL